MQISKLVAIGGIAVAALGAGTVGATSPTSPPPPDSPDDATGQPGDSPDDVPAGEGEGTTGATGIGIAPSFVEFEDTLRGNSYTTSVILINGLPGDREFVLTPEGENTDWFSFSDETGTPTDRVVIPHEGVATIELSVSIPADTANGEYEGSIDVAGVALDGDDDGEGSGAGLSIGALIPVSITVGGDMRRGGSFDDVRVSSTEVGIPLQIRASFNNTGNVAFSPSLELQISRGDQVVDVVDVPPENPISPGRAEDIEVFWQTTDTLPGDYILLATAAAEGYEFEPIEVPFRIEQAGSVERAGSLESLAVVNEPVEGGVAQIRGLFRNESDVPVSAILVAEVVRDGDLVGEIRSLEILAGPNNVTNINATIDDIVAGDYVVTGKVNYEGRETEAVSVNFTVNGADTPGDESVEAAADIDSGPGAMLLAAGIGATGVVIGVPAVLVSRRRRNARADDGG